MAVAARVEVAAQGSEVAVKGNEAMQTVRRGDGHWHKAYWATNTSQYNLLLSDTLTFPQNYVGLTNCGGEI